MEHDFKEIKINKVPSGNFRISREGKPDLIGNNETTLIALVHYLFEETKRPKPENYYHKKPDEGSV